MRNIEIIVEAENNQAILNVLEGSDINVRSVKDLKALAKPNENVGGKGCCGESKKKSPSLLKKFENYTNTMAKWIKAGRPIVDMKTFARRCTICSTCDSLKSYECVECGCPMDSKAKMNIDNLCELNKW